MIRRLKVRMCGVTIKREPDCGADEACKTHNDEHPAPAEDDHQQGQEGSGDGLAEMVRAGEDAYRRSALIRCIPAPDCLGTGWQGRCFSHPEQKAGCPKLGCIAGEAAEALREGPYREAASEQQARSKPIDDQAQWELRQRVGQRKSREQKAHFRNGETHIVPDRWIGDRERDPIHVVDDADD